MTTANGHDLESALEQLLAEQADALIVGLEDFDPQWDQYDIPAAHTAEAKSLLQLGSWLHQTLEPVSPSMLLAARRGLNVLSALQGRGQTKQEAPLPLKPAT